MMDEFQKWLDKSGGGTLEDAFAAGMAARQEHGEAVALMEVVRTAPARIYLNISDEYEHRNDPFHEFHEISWCDESVVAVEVPYVRADLAHPAPDAGRVAIPDCYIGGLKRYLKSCAEQVGDHIHGHLETIDQLVAAAGRIAALESQLAESRERVGRMREALEDARLFIRNGIELGYIRMPDADTPDPAHNTLPRIEAALATDKEQTK